MKQCPYCGSDLPNDKEIFCVKCSHIIDDDFLLRKEIKKELESMSPTKKKAKSKKNHTQPSVSNKRKNDGYVSVKYDEKKSYANIVLIVIVGILLLYLFLNQMIISKNPQFTGISARQQLEFTTHLLLTD